MVTYFNSSQKEETKMNKTENGKIINRTSHQRNANESKNDVLPHLHQNSQNHKRVTNDGENVKK